MKGLAASLRDDRAPGAHRDNIGGLAASLASGARRFEERVPLRGLGSMALPGTDELDAASRMPHNHLHADRRQPGDGDAELKRHQGSRDMWAGDVVGGEGQRGAGGSQKGLFRSIPHAVMYGGGGRGELTVEEEASFHHGRIGVPPGAAGGTHSQELVAGEGGRGLRECVEEVNRQGGGTVHVRGGGDVTWSGDAVVQAWGVNVTCGLGGASLRGRWLLRDGSGGVVSGGGLSWGGGAAGMACVTVRGGPWLVQQCGVRCEVGSAVVCEGEARVLVQASTLGGSGGGGRRAAAALVLVEGARCLVEESTLCDAGTPRCMGAGVRASGEARCTLQRCVVERCDVCIAVGGHARLTARGTTLREATMGALKSEEGGGGRLVMTGTRVTCTRMWYGEGRPQTVKITNS